jgi:exodeoxyribonuclease V alpha subunit
VANGDIGEVVFVDEKIYHVELKTPTRRIVVPRGQAKGDESGCTFDLAYGLSCHKSQGSEFPVAIVMLDDSPGGKMVCSKEWAYTAISRAKQRCYLIGKKSTADAMCRKQVIDKRKTFLRERILLNVSNLEMMEI